MTASFVNALPAFETAGECFDHLDQGHQFALITGNTGSGKSISVLSYGHHIMNSVFMSQPRKMAAAMVAEPVAAYVGSEVGKEVGYNTAMESLSSDETTTFLRTDGLLLRQYLQSPESFDQVGHLIVLDEQHERRKEMDLLLALFLQTKYPRYTLKYAKVIVMSATANVPQLQQYFMQTQGVDLKLFEAAARTKNLQQHFKPASEYMNCILGSVQNGKNVLAFRASQQECEQTADAIRTQVGNNVDVYAVYSDQKASIREAAMAPTENGRQKVVVSTNVSQTSITPQDIQTVVDDAMEIRPVYKDGMTGIQLGLASKSDVMQRAGRVGRIEDGDAYYCCDTPFEELEEYPLPPMITSDVTDLYLLLASYGINLKDLPLMNPPSKEQLASAEDYLKKVKAITTNNGKTNVGLAMLAHPLEPQAARMLVEAKSEHYHQNVLRYLLAMSALVSDQGVIDKSSEVWKGKSLDQSFSDMFSQTQLFLETISEVKNLEDEEREEALVELGMKPQRFERALKLYKELCRRETRMAKSAGKKVGSLYEPLTAPIDLSTDQMQDIQRCIVTAYWPYMAVKTSKGLYCTITRKSLELESNSVLKESLPAGGFAVGMPFHREIGENIRYFMTWTTQATNDLLFDSVKNFGDILVQLKDIRARKDGLKNGKGHGKKDCSRNSRRDKDDKTKSESKSASKRNPRSRGSRSLCEGSKKLCNVGQNKAPKEVEEMNRRDMKKLDFPQYSESKE